MITKNNFINIIRKIEEYELFVNKVLNYVHLEKFDEFFIPGEVQNMLFKSLFNEKQADLINAYLYDYEEFLSQVGEDISTADELYDYLINETDYVGI